MVYKELYLPATGFEVRVKVGDKVKGGQSVVAAMLPPTDEKVTDDGEPK